MIDEIAGYPAETIDVDLDTADTDEPQPSAGIRLYRVARLEELVDREALLRGGDGPDPPYWALVWIGARAIAARLRRHPPSPEARVLDLGCGLGLTGVVAGLAGCEVTFADYVDDALAFARASAELHELQRFTVRRLDFTRDRTGQRYDLILAADVIYDPAHYRPLVDFLDAHLATGGTILMTETLRADARDVLRMLAELGYTKETEPVWIEEEGKPERTWLHALRRAAAP